MLTKSPLETNIDAVIRSRFQYNLNVVSKHRSQIRKKFQDLLQHKKGHHKTLRITYLTWLSIIL